MNKLLNKTKHFLSALLLVFAIYCNATASGTIGVGSGKITAGTGSIKP